MRIFKEFKEFAIKGNVIDLAIGVVIGAAFTKIVNSLIEDVITPLLLKPALQAAHLSKLADLTVFGTVKYGSFLSALIGFIIVAMVLFMIVKAINAAKKKEEDLPHVTPPPSKEVMLLTEIRNLLRDKK